MNERSRLLLVLFRLRAIVRRRYRQVCEYSSTSLGRRYMARAILSRFLPIVLPIVTGWRRSPLYRSKVIAVVGSFGKTTTTRAVMAALDLPAAEHVGWNAGIARSLDLLRGGLLAPYRVTEVGISRPGDMTRAALQLRPDLVVVTSMGSEHHLSFGTIEAIRAEKAQILQHLPSDGVAFLNGDDPNVLWMGDQTAARTVLFGFGPDNDVRIAEVTLDPRPRMSLALQIGDRRIPLTVRLIGRHMAYAVAAAVAVAWDLGVPMDAALSRVAELPPTPERLEGIRAEDGTLLLLDSFKSIYETIEMGIDTLSDLPAEQRIAVLGDIETPKGSQGPLYRALGRRLAGVADAVVYVGGKKSFASLRKGARDAGRTGDSFIYVGRAPLDAVPVLTDGFGDGTVIWIKGRTNQHLARIGWALAGKDVRCALTTCTLWQRCGTCPMLERPPRRQQRLPMR